MDDGSRLPLWGLFMLILLLWLNGIFYGFAAAAQNLNENEVEKKAFGGDKKSRLLLPYWRDLPSTSTPYR